MCCLHITFWKWFLHATRVSSVLTSPYCTTIFISSVWIRGDAGLIWEGAIGVSIIQHGHLTPLQLDAMNYCTKQPVLTNALHDSSRGLCIISRHKGHWSWSSVSGLLKLPSIWSFTENPVRMGGAIPHIYGCNNRNWTIVGWSACELWLWWWFWMTYMYLSVHVNCCEAFNQKGSCRKFGTHLDWCFSITRLHR